MAAIVLLDEESGLLAFLVADRDVDIPLKTGRSYWFTVNASHREPTPRRSSLLSYVLRAVFSGNPSPQCGTASSKAVNQTPSELFRNRNNEQVLVQTMHGGDWQITGEFSDGLKLSLAFPDPGHGTWTIQDGDNHHYSGRCTTDLLWDFEHNFKNPSEMETCTDDLPSLYAEVARWALAHHDRGGIAGMNIAEKVLASLFEFDNECSNGGTGQWLYETPGDLLACTTFALEEIGATEVAELAGRILRSAGGDILFVDRNMRASHLDALPGQFHERIDQDYVMPAKLKAEFYAKLYEYVKANWKTVRRPE